MKKTFFILLCFISLNSFSQIQRDTVFDEERFLKQIYPAIIHKGDTIPFNLLPIINIKEKRVFKSKEDEQYYYRLKRKVIKVYPYALIAAENVRMVNDSIKKLTKRKYSKKYINEVQDKLEEEFGETLKKMYVSEGIILMKLIERETGSSTYNLVKDYKGGFLAFVFQKGAQLYGTTLKSNYNPTEDKEDKMIEAILKKEIEEGTFDRYIRKDIIK